MPTVSGFIRLLLQGEPPVTSIPSHDPIRKRRGLRLFVNREPRYNWICDNGRRDLLGRRSMSLTLDEANRIIRGALAKAQELNIKISAAVCDSGGRLIALQRMDNAIWASAYGSQGKAVASAAFRRARGGMAGRGRPP